MKRTVSEVLTEAADYIDQHGWCQGRYIDGGAVCLSGAINMCVSGNPKVTSPPAWEAKDKVRKVIGRTLERWNDDSARTQEEVTAVLRKAADLARTGIKP